MDDLIVWAVVFLVLGGIGWLLGIIAFVRANRALAELRGLRLEFAAQRTVVAPVVEPVPVTEPLPPAVVEGAPVLEPPPLPSPMAPRPGRDWEALLTAKWGVWLGAAALLLSGVFLIRYASDEGLLGPGARCVAAVVLGVALIASAEWLRRRSTPLTGMADYAPGALAAGGVAVLFAAAYAAGPLYGLVATLLAFALMAAAALSGLALSLRMGQLVAAVGLVGSFATPFLVGSTETSIPGLFAYLLFVATASLAVVRYTAWVWLGWATTMACAGFVLIIALDGPITDGWAPALFVPAAMALVLALLPGPPLEHLVGRRLAYVPLLVLGLAGLLLAFVAPGLATRAGVLLLAPLTLAKAAREDRLDRLPWLAALLFLLLVTGWGLPPWQPSGEAITAGGNVIAMLPGDWVPRELRPLLLTSLAVVTLFAAAGFWGERRCPNPLRWAALPAALPVLTMAILYARVDAFQPDDLWAGAAVLLATLSTLAAAAAARDSSVARAGAHAAGACAALALGCGAVLSAQWLTVALSLFLPALAAIEHRAGLTPLRRVALVVAVVAGVRLLLNPGVLDYGAGGWPVVNGLLAAYGVAAIAFAGAARMFRRGADDLVVAVLELGSAAFLAALTLLEVRHWVTGGHPDAPDIGFLEAALDVSALAVLALLALRLYGRSARPMIAWAAACLSALAMVGGVGLILANPAFVPGERVGLGALNALLPAYLAPSLVALAALRMVELPARARPVLLGYAIAASFVWLTLTARHAFHPGAMDLDGVAVEDAELWAWSGAWLAFGAALMTAGIVTGRKALRLTALAVIALAGAKVFLVDMAGLTGLWRVLSFLGLGLTLIAIGAVYRRFVASGPAQAAGPRTT